MIPWTDEQLNALDADPEPRFLNPRTQETYVLVESKRYGHLRALLSQDEDLDMNQVAILVERAMREDDASDPTLAYYQQSYGKTP